MFDTVVHLNDSFATALAFVYAALNKTLPEKLQREFEWGCTKDYEETRTVVKITGSTIEKKDPINNDQSRKVVCEIDNGYPVTLYLKQRIHADKSKGKWRVVVAEYIHVGFDFNFSCRVEVQQ